MRRNNAVVIARAFTEKDNAEFRQQTSNAIKALQTYVDMTNKAIGNMQQQNELQKASVDYHTGKIHEKIDDLEKRICSSIGTIYQDIGAKLTLHAQKIKVHTTYLEKVEKLVSEFNSFRSEFANFSPELIRFREEVRKGLSMAIDSLNAKHDAFISEIKSIPSGVPELKKDIESKLEAIALDGTNAILRSSNCEKHLNLVEKKIESILLLIKKIDLNQQGS